MQEKVVQITTSSDFINIYLYNNIRIFLFQKYQVLCVVMELI